MQGELFILCMSDLCESCRRNSATSLVTLGRDIFRVCITCKVPNG